MNNNSLRQFPKRLADTVAPPSPEEALRLQHLFGVLGWGVYIGGPYCSPNRWTRQLVDEYVKAKACTGLAPIYVGQQAGPDFGPWTPAKTAGGARDGQEAVALAKDFGWEGRRYIFLDVESETVDAAGAELQAYVADWCADVEDLGFWPGVYCPPRFVPELIGTRCAFVWVAAWIADRFVDVHPDSIPGVDADLWPKHRMWQYAGNAEVLGFTLDLSAYNHWLDGAPA